MRKTKADVAEARRYLLENIGLYPGRTAYTVLKHVFASGMSRRIAVLAPRCLGKGLEEIINISGPVSIVLDNRWCDDDSVYVSGCGMDMGFHLVHNLGYCLFGKEASEGTTKAATRLRRDMLEANTSYYTQGGNPAPDPAKPGRVWFGGAGYALKHAWR